MFLVYFMYVILISSLNFFLPFLAWSNCCWFLFLLLNVDILLCFSNPPVYSIDHKSTYTFYYCIKFESLQAPLLYKFTCSSSFISHPIYYFIVHLLPCFPSISCPFLNPALSEITHKFNYSFLNSWIFQRCLLNNFIIFHLDPIPTSFLSSSLTQSYGLPWT